MSSRATGFSNGFPTKNGAGGLSATDPVSGVDCANIFQSIVQPQPNGQLPAQEGVLFNLQTLTGAGAGNVAVGTPIFPQPGYILIITNLLTNGVAGTIELQLYNQGTTVNPATVDDTSDVGAPLIASNLLNGWFPKNFAVSPMQKVLPTWLSGGAGIKLNVIVCGYVVRDCPDRWPLIG